MWKFTKNKEDILLSFINIASPYMEEVPMASQLRQLWQHSNVKIDTDVMGNVRASLQGAKSIDVGLIAHMDTTCVQISKILPNGFLRFRSIGIKPHVLLGMPMQVITSTGVVLGLIGFDTLSQQELCKSGTEYNDLWLDIGASNFDEASEIVKIGDFAVFKPQFNIINEQYISASGIDNRIGLFVINECLQWFAQIGAPLNLHFIGSVQEEIGSRGATVCTATQPLNVCFVIDTDHATDTLISHENQMGELRLGSGVGIHKKADNNPVLQQLVCECAKRNHIPIQMSLGRFVYGGTDSSILQLQSGGIATLNINIPCRYIHSPIELCHKSDIENVINLLITTIYEIGDNNKSSFIPGLD